MNSRQITRIWAHLAVVLLSLVAMTSASWAAFTDTQGNWAEPAILRLEAQGWMEGFPDGTFRPDSLLSRAQLAKTVVECSGVTETPPETSKMTFLDVSPLHWAFPWVEYAESKDLIRGYPDGTYLPERAVSVLEMLTVFVRAKGWLEVTPSIPFFANIPSSHWGYSTVMTALRHHFLLVPDPTFIDMPDPLPLLQAEQQSTRAQVAVLLDRLLRIQLETPSYDLEQERGFQEEADQGNQSWRLSAEESARSFLSDPAYAGSAMDGRVVVEAEDEGEAFVFAELVQGNFMVHLKRLVKVGPTGIWTVVEVDRNTPSGI
ncbi:MAG: S-layer homology domain-containing protein [Coprothermobacterota bacterium]|jgi:hypothetical protein|nr:S-layer homology domain-containing protein [Coprothermobacterota bacterium]